MFTYVYFFYSIRSFFAAAVVNARSQTMTFKEPENLIFHRHESQQQQQRYTEKRGEKMNKKKFLILKVPSFDTETKQANGEMEREKERLRVWNINT